jgi:hypothetical protein
VEFLSNKTVRRLLTILAIICVVLIGLYIYKLSQNPYGDQLEIANLNKYTNSKPINKQSLEYIKHDLYQTVNLNTKPAVKNNSIKDIYVRDESFSQTFNSSKHVYTTHFIVDIKSLKQSYRVSYQWTTDDAKYGPNKAEYGTQVQCLPIGELLYGDFKCKDARIIENSTKNYDPITKLLPYHVETKFEVTSYVKSGSNVTLYVDPYPRADEVRVSQADLTQYTALIKAWLNSNKLDPSKYLISYNY